jgi:L-glutamine-phosphate cytidylyltransferase
MLPTRALILAAGYGSRMGDLTADRPKAMLDVDGRSLIEHQLDALASYGVRDVTVVVGYQAQRMREHLGKRVTFVENKRYRETNSVYSLWLARDVLRRGAMVMNSDLLVSQELFGRLVMAPVEDAVLVDRTSEMDEEEMKVKIWQGFAVDFGKDLPASDAHAENVGILKFGAEGGRRLVEHLDALIGGGLVNAWAPRAFRALASAWPLRAIDTAGLPWTEIDFPEDLARAREVIAPAIGLRGDERRAA